MSEFSLSGHSALITGSSRGIGSGIAQAMARAGAGLVLHGLEEEPENPAPRDVPYLRHDLTKGGARSALLDEAFARHPGLDLLVCNAGGFFDVPFLTMTPDRWSRTMTLNVEAVYFLIQDFARRLVAARRPGAVVITSSVNGFQAEYDSTAYDTSKGALVMMTRSLALALAEHGIRVNGLAPGFIETPLTAQSLARDPRLRPALERKIALGRLGQPADCGGAVVFLCSAAASYLTGQVLVVDGGLTLGQLPRPEENLGN